MLTIDFANGDHKIQWQATEQQKELIRVFKQPIKRRLAEEQAARYRRDPDKYRSLSSVATLLEEGICSPYLGAIGGGDTYILHKIYGLEQEYSVQYKYLDSLPIWLTDPLGVKADGVYRVTPTSLGYVVHYEVDISDYEQW